MESKLKVRGGVGGEWRDGQKKKEKKERKKLRDTNKSVVIGGRGVGGGGRRYREINGNGKIQ